MPLTDADLKFYKAKTETDTAASGGAMSRLAVLPSARYNILPRVTKAERLNGLTRLRKLFLCNYNAADEVAQAALVYLEHPTAGPDRIHLAASTPTESKSQIPSNIVWVGCGSLVQALTGGETQVQLSMEGTDVEFPNGGLLYLNNKYQTGQTIDAAAGIGSSVLWDGGLSRWTLIAATDDITYPKGRVIGAGLVQTDNGAAEEFRRLADNLYEGEVIAVGDGSSTTPTLAALAHAAAGICKQPGKLPVIKAVCGGQERIVTVGPDGVCTGYCTAGVLNLDNGLWSTPIAWSTAPDNGTNLTAAYRENCWTWSGNTAVLKLADAVAHAYAVGVTFGCPCLELGDLKPLVVDFVDTNTLAGTFNEVGYALVLSNQGTEYDLWTLTFSSATAFSVSGALIGAVGSGVITADFAPINPASGKPYFTLAKEAWGGTWAAGQNVTFTTLPAGKGFWIRQLVPVGAAAAPSNEFALAAYTE